MTFFYKIFFLLLVVVCGQLPVSLFAAGDKRPVAILLSDDESVYHGPVKAFHAEIDHPQL